MEEGKMVVMQCAAQPKLQATPERSKENPLAATTLRKRVSGVASGRESLAYSRHERWKPEDLVFAANELSREFPNCAWPDIEAAVNSATPFVVSSEGRVKLM